MRKKNKYLTMPRRANHVKPRTASLNQKTDDLHLEDDNNDCEILDRKSNRTTSFTTTANSSPRRSLTDRKKLDDKSNLVNSIIAEDPNKEEKENQQYPQSAIPNILDQLKKKFEDLNMLRSTAAESMFLEYKTIADARIAAAEKALEVLKRENSRLVEECKRHKKSTVRNDEDRQEVPGSSDALSLKLQKDDKSDGLWHCNVLGRIGELRFDLQLCEQESQYLYRPNIVQNDAFTSILPAYLLEEIVFDVEQLPMFFWRVKNFLMTTTNGNGDKKGISQK